MRFVVKALKSRRDALPGALRRNCQDEHSDGHRAPALTSSIKHTARNPGIHPSTRATRNTPYIAATYSEIPEPAGESKDTSARTSAQAYKAIPVRSCTLALGHPCEKQRCSHSEQMFLIGIWPIGVPIPDGHPSGEDAMGIAGRLQAYKGHPVHATDTCLLVSFLTESYDFCVQDGFRLPQKSLAASCSIGRHGLTRCCEPGPIGSPAEIWGRGLTADDGLECL
ncbi:hypothetical protein NUW54_g10255 [Trametes sanguinea]|uniref:Uncharacterized protein n=1 Tax=Trametes sanguinea TaxID=158606 RepID=A0ACC1P1I1_9APHY|nr:hypothetical protein NUW54_g10255 [Trametes sanguinea]